ncbi:MAG: 4Fe-4S binding protein, partial [Anaerolineales bacterium]
REACFNCGACVQQCPESASAVGSPLLPLAPGPG